MPNKGIVTIFHSYKFNIPVKNPVFMGFYAVNETCSVALARYPLAIPFRPHTVENKYTYKILDQSILSDPKRDFKKVIRRFLLNVHLLNLS